jgi:hypothetical protein
MKPKFKIGDRVELVAPISDIPLSLGSTGTIITYSPVPTVNWDNCEVDFCAIEYKLKKIKQNQSS